MAGCCPHAQSAARWFSWFARHYRKRFAKRGFEPCQRHLLEGLAEAGYSQATVLELGCGVGHLHQTLLEQGARHAVGIDLAPRMIAEARAWAAERGLAERTVYLEGDFMDLARDVERADITLLDKVVCCYPDAEHLLEQSLAKTERVCGLVYPRNRWFMRLAARLVGAAMWLLRSEFRPYVHDPERIEAWLRGAGLSKRYENQTAAWLSQVWVRAV